MKTDFFLILCLKITASPPFTLSVPTPLPSPPSWSITFPYLIRKNQATRDNQALQKSSSVRLIQRSSHQSWSRQTNRRKGAKEKHRSLKATHLHTLESHKRLKEKDIIYKHENCFSLSPLLSASVSEFIWALLSWFKCPHYLDVSHFLRLLHSFCFLLKRVPWVLTGRDLMETWFIPEYSNVSSLYVFPDCGSINLFSSAALIYLRGRAIL